MRYTYILCKIITLLILLSSCKTNNSKIEIDEEILITKKTLMDKIMGGWAGQVIGCTYGGPTEFQWNGTMIGDHVPIPWDETRMLWYFKNFPGLYDDVYMDLTFVDVFEEFGLDASDSLHAAAFAKAEYPLWHANQTARYNILNGIMPPESGHWKNNPHADDIDFQIEADFAGLMSPGMINSAIAICDKIGHIMNYGDGFYGGVFVASLYSLAFISNDISFIITESLRTIPKESVFFQCISDVIKWYNMNPNDWKYAWFECQKKWTHDKGCPDGVFRSYNIDAKINAAYIVIGLLYGRGDYGATIDISTRCGYDSDCNPASAGGILGTMLGYSNIPDFWKQGINKIENINFEYTEMSLNKVYDIGFRHAIEMIKRNGGVEKDDTLIIKYQTPEPVPLEICFDKIYPTKRTPISAQLSKLNKEVSFNITGSGFVVSGNTLKKNESKEDVLEIELYINNNFIELIKMPTSFLIRKNEVVWNYNLPEATHSITLKVKYVPDGYSVNIKDVIVYSSIKPSLQTFYTQHCFTITGAMTAFG